VNRPYPQHALSVDLEEWYHPELVRDRLGHEPHASRVGPATDRLLDLLARSGTAATFFCVGEVAEREPDLLRRIDAAGHEIAFHGWRHQRLDELDPDRFAAELGRFDELLSALLGPGRRAAGFRAPTFSLARPTAWALGVLARHGYRYDSSVFPLRGPLYGVAGAPLGAYRVALDEPARVEPGSPLIEVPVAIWERAGVRLPAGGGAYLRLLPRPILERLLDGIAARRPIVLYVHPWETDPGTPRLPLPRWARLATYAGIDSSLAKLDALLGRFRFGRIDHLVARAEAAPGGEPC
jgi:polysaccharide deacetylase family protein (PEP-CTERM system associated)